MPMGAGLAALGAVRRCGQRDAGPIGVPAVAQRWHRQARPRSVADLVGSCDCYSLSYSDLDEAVAALDELSRATDV